MFIKHTHSIRILESIVELARKDLVYIQSALILSRSLFETLIKTSWILNPSDIFELESRYVAQLNTECEFWKKWVKELVRMKQPSDRQQRFYEDILEFKNSLTNILNKKGYKIPTLPNILEMLQSLNEERKYLYYILLSQYTHMTHYAGKIYRKNLGVDKKLKEESSIDDWKLVFSISWPVFEFATELYVLKTGNKESIYSNEFKEQIRQSLENIA